MPNPTGVSRRIEYAIMGMGSRDYEAALVNLFPALDKTAKRRWPKKGVGDRIKAFLVEEEKLISYVAIGGIFAKNYFNGVAVTDALYKFGRTSIAHEGELDPRLKFSETGEFAIGQDNWLLPVGYIAGMIMACILAPENHNEGLSKEYQFSLKDQAFSVSQLWGQRAQIRKMICDRFNDPNLFKD